MREDEIKTNEKQPALVGQLRRKLNKYCLGIIAVSQILVIIIVAVIYTWLGGLNGSMAFIISVSTVVVIEVIAMVLVEQLVLDPLDILTRAISTSMQEKPDVYPPNPNQVSGLASEELSKAISYVYGNSEKMHSSRVDRNVSDRLAANSAAVDLLRSLPIGIIAMDNDYKIVAHNKLSPVATNDGELTVQLDFTGSGVSLKDWFESVRGGSITATQTWTRVQNVPNGSLEERHVYDVVADYRQQPTSGANLIVITIDKTAEYVDSEDNIDFVALAAHELRGPITVIRGYLDMLDEQIYDTSTQEQRDLLDRLNVGARRLASYVNNILNANRYDRHHLKLKLEKTSVADIVDGVKEDLDLRAETVDRHITWHIPKNLPYVAADISSVGEVITNLVDNAIKYSHAGGEIIVEAKRSDDFVAVSVIDHGIGIALSATNRLFTKFYRSHRSSASIGGSGIGLYISRAIIDSHGGSIGVDSTEGEGSTFTFTLPIYDKVKDKMVDDMNVSLIERDKKWIKNHGTVRE